MIQPELLDSLPPQHPDALHNRRDLRLTNRLMGNHRWLLETLPNYLRVDDTILEVGAGTGELCHQLQTSGFRADGLDLWPAPDDWPDERAWHRSDLRTFGGYADYSVVIGNLIFHQFDEKELAAIGAAITPNARLIVACEPTRRRISQVMYRVLGPLFGVNEVSLHDAHVSISAGFVRRELPRALGLADDTWEIHCDTTLRGAYHLIAVRRT